MIRAWHFVGKALRDGSPIPADGEWLGYDGELAMCRSGLHASRDPFDALQYAPGETLCLVDCDGEVIEHQDKLVCSRRRIVARMDFTEPLRYFARMQALSVIHLWDAPQVVLDYLMTGDGALSAAALNAARDAASVAAWNAAWNAARGAASVAAWAAVSAAASDAAWNAVSAAASDDFNAMVNECFEGPLSCQS
jgi:hypothetical protein